ncbi:MAG: ribosomal RNA small subunit methyltransferase A [Planctomycetia bacterium]|nr:ribosomal RNA small subunit methyltransferase A [Planctomycetia bacterium]
MTKDNTASLTQDPSLPSPRQTLSYLHQVFQTRGLEPKSKLGQCFLVDLNLMDLLVRSAELSSQDLALEIGCGTGSLTMKLAEAAGAVVGIEIDKGFFQLAHDLTRAWNNVDVLHGDVLKSKHILNPDWLQVVRDKAKLPGIQQIKLTANLPYVVATPVVINLLLLDDLPIERMVVMVQLEMAERLVAKPSTKDYNANSIFVQSLCDVEMVRKIGPKAFFPPPKVDSSIIRIWPRPEKRQQIIDSLGSVTRLHRFLHGLYLHRRKNLRGALYPLYREQLDKPGLDQRIAGAGFDVQGRAEALTVEEHLRLCQALPDLSV